MDEVTYAEVDVGAVAHGGHCVARLPDTGQVVFVRHALPGERVRIRITEDAGSYCRADAVEVLRSSPERVAPPCPHAGPGRCGGCDWQHASAAMQRELKAAVVREQFARLAHLDVDVTVRALPGGMLGWRTRTAYAVDASGALGLRRHRSHEVELLESCPLGMSGVGESPVLAEQWPGVTGVEVARSDDGALATLTHRPGPGRQARGRRPPDRVQVVDGPRSLVHRAVGREFTVAADGFWQVHPHAADVFAGALLEAVAPTPGERVLDLYAGAGLLTAALALAVGPDGSVLGLESARQAVVDADANLTDLPWAEVRRTRIDARTVAELDLRADVIVLDPPRAGAGRQVMEAILAAEPRIVGYVACDPAALARDVRVALDQGWQLASLQAFDAFPMTHHVECVASLTPGARPIVSGASQLSETP